MKRIISLSVLGLLLCGNIFVTEHSATAQKIQADATTPKKHSLSGYVYAEGFKIPEGGNPVEAAYRYFELNKDRYHIVNPREELLLKRQERDDYGAMVSFTQVYNGVPLLYSDIRAHFDGRGVLKEVEGDYVYDINLTTTPQIDSATVENLALKDLGFPKDAKVVNNKKKKASTQMCIWLHQDGKFHLIWVVWISQDYPKTHAWQYYIDAHDGTVLKKADRMIRD